MGSDFYSRQSNKATDPIAGVDFNDNVSLTKHTMIKEDGEF